MTADATTGSSPEGPGGGALAGLRVLDLSTLYAAPLLAAMLGDFGADVVKAEPRGGDPIRRAGASRGGTALPWVLVGRNKRTIEIDFATPEGLDLLHALVRAADVVVLNQPRKVLARWACTPEEIARDNPSAVVVWMSGYGATGPMADKPGNGSQVEAFAGVTHVTGEADGPPVMSSVPLGDTMAALLGVIGALAACYWRDARGGTGQVVDVSMYESVMTLMAATMVNWQPGQPPPMRTGSRFATGVPRNTYLTRDGQWVVVAGVTDPQVARILPLIGRDDEESRRLYGRSDDRNARADELDALVAEWIRDRDCDAVVAAFDEARIPVSRVNDLAQLRDEPQVRARQAILEVERPDTGVVVMPAPTPRFSRTPARVAWTGRPLSADVDEILKEWLGGAS